jgi:multisubunit Na+/H+ antiporter MnhG subunit
VDYPLNIGGKPLFAFEFSVPVDFELSILGTAIFTVVGLFGLCKLPTWYNKYQDDESFKKATDDTFVVTIDADDDRFSAEQTAAFLTTLGAANVHLVTAP